MKTFLGHYTIIEGEHEHRKIVLIKAKDKEKADKLFASQEHDCEITDDDELTYWDYGDGYTIAQFSHCEEVAKEELKTIEKFGLAYFMTIGV